MRHPKSGGQRDVPAPAVQLMERSGWQRLTAAELAEREKQAAAERDRRRAQLTGASERAPEPPPRVSTQKADARQRRQDDTTENEEH
jgi:hypothetical protein